MSVSNIKPKKNFPKGTIKVIVSYRIILYHIVSYGFTLYGFTLYHIVLYNLGTNLYCIVSLRTICSQIYCHVI